MAATVFGSTRIPRDDKKCPKYLISTAPTVILSGFKVNRLPVAFEELHVHELRVLAPNESKQ